jgi:ABC-2 type transport system ATP-binding protein
MTAPDEREAQAAEHPQPATAIPEPAAKAAVYTAQAAPKPQPATAMEEPAAQAAVQLVQIEQLWRSFGPVIAVRDLSFSIPRGAVVGFIGANGAGKTTTMRVLATLDEPTSGTVRVAGYDVTERPAEVRQLVGWMPDHFGTYANMTVFEYLDFFARAYGLDAARRRDRVEEVMSFADLDILADRQMAKLSKGMSQRLCFGRMLIPDPEFMILDEPAAGLDPKARLEFKNLVRILANRGKTLLISSHILSELGEMCDHIVFIDKGRMVFEGRADELRNGATAEGTATDVEVTVAGGTEALRDWIGTRQGWSIVAERPRGALVRCPATDEAGLAAALRQLVIAGIDVVEFRREQRRLEEAFVDLVKRLE